MFHIIFCTITLIIGCYANINQLYWPYHVQTSLVGIPIIYVGWIYIKWRKNRNIITNFNIFFSTLFSFILIYLILLYEDFQGIELSVNRIINPTTFYLLTFLGIIFCTGIAHYIEKIKTIKKIISSIGKNSFHIMALHFFCFKLVDICYGTYIQADAAVIENFPYAFSVPIIYYFVGTVFPILFISVIRLLRKNCKMYFVKLTQ